MNPIAFQWWGRSNSERNAVRQHKVWVQTELKNIFDQTLLFVHPIKMPLHGRWIKPEQIKHIAPIGV